MASETRRSCWLYSTGKMCLREQINISPRPRMSILGRSRTGNGLELNNRFLNSVELHKILKCPIVRRSVAKVDFSPVWARTVIPALNNQDFDRSVISLQKHPNLSHSAALKRPSMSPLYSSERFMLLISYILHFLSLVSPYLRAIFCDAALPLIIWNVTLEKFWKNVAESFHRETKRVLSSWQFFIVQVILFRDSTGNLRVLK